MIGAYIATVTAVSATNLLEKSLRETEDYLNEMPGVLAVFDLDEAPHYSSFCRWDQDYQMRELRRLLRRSAEQAAWSGEAAIDASSFQRDQTSHHYRNRADYSFRSLKTTILIDMESLAIKDVHYTTRKSWDGHIGMQVFRIPAEDLRVLAADGITRGATSAKSVVSSQRVRSSSTRSTHR